MPRDSEEEFWYNEHMAVPILKEPPITARDAVIPYAMTAVNMLAPILAARTILSGQVLIAACALVLLGVPCSVYFRQRGYNRIVLNLITTLPLLLLTWGLTRTHPGLQLDWSNPLASMLSRDSIDQLAGMLHVFTVLAAGRAFLLLASTDLLQTPLPGISIFLLTIISHKRLDTDPWSLLYLLALFITSAYLFSHEQHQQWFARHTPPRIQRQLLSWTLLFALLLFPLVFLLGMRLQSFNMMAVTRAMSARRMHDFGAPFSLGNRTVIALGERVEMGGQNWPRGRQPIMTVEVEKNAPSMLLWRGATYDTYRNGAWESSLFQDSGTQRGTDYAYSPYNSELGTLSIDPVGACSDLGLAQAIEEKQLIADDLLLTQQFRTLAPLAGDIVPIYGLYQMYDIIGSSRLLHNAAVADDGAVTLRNTQRRRPTEYIVRSLIKPLPTLLRLQQPPALPDPARYLQMPGAEYQQRIRETAHAFLARREVDLLTATDFDIVRQFELELNQQYRYTLKPAPPSRGADPIIDFLEEQKQGYCTYFAGAMVMLCRSMDIPARLVVGFAAGETDDNHQNPDTLLYRVTASDAHSWAEVYLQGYGWYAIDPTAGSQVVPSLGSILWDSLLEVIGSVKSWFVAAATAFRTSPVVRMSVLGGLALLISLAILFAIVLRDRPPAMPKRELSSEDARKMVLLCYRHMHRWMKRWGVYKPDGCTATEFERLFHALNPTMGEPVRLLTSLYIRTEYGGYPLTDADARTAITLMRTLWVLAKTERRQLYQTAKTEN